MDLIGKQFGRLLVIGAMPEQKRPTVICRCSCGKETFKRVYDLERGHSLSCGCSRTKHGQSTTRSITPEYMVWNAMKARCLNPKNKRFKEYGGRGITVCESWLKFENFFADMGMRPSGKHSIERKNNNLGYSPDNCIWADADTQHRNRSDNRFITFNGKTKILTDWANELGINKTTLRLRLKSWPIERALTESSRRIAKSVLEGGKG